MMNYSKAVKGGTTSQLISINSAAETEIGRKLTKIEISKLSGKFSLDEVMNSIEKVRSFFLLDDKLSSNILQYGLQHYLN